MKDVSESKMKLECDHFIVQKELSVLTAFKKANKQKRLRGWNR